MKHVIIGTAGHVDHGKTLLVKALTGIDTDRLVEEKKRGITIDLGFAHLDFEDGTQAGLVDVPGHEKFIKNMLAGAGGIDLAMLVVAADEGFMPQTVHVCADFVDESLDAFCHSSAPAKTLRLCAEVNPITVHIRRIIKKACL